MWPGVLFLVWLNTFAKLLLELHAPPPFLMRSCTIWWLVSLCSTCNTTKLLYARRTQVEDLLTSFLKIFHSNMNPLPPPPSFTPLYHIPWRQHRQLDLLLKKCLFEQSASTGRQEAIVLRGTAHTRTNTTHRRRVTLEREMSTSSVKPHVFYDVIIKLTFLTIMILLGTSKKLYCQVVCVCVCVCVCVNVWKGGSVGEGE